MHIPEPEYRRILNNVPILCVDLLIVYNGKCLLLKRDNEPAKGEFWFAGGRIRKFESIENAAIRIAKEETNLDCKYKKIISIEETIFSKTDTIHSDVHTVNICCEMIPVNIESFKFDKYHNDYKWVYKQSNSYHKAINHPLSLMGFNDIESLG
ncbi:MAG: NUDIX domain-containing protein [Planctomycetes bacterium]|nr:NUDIX domain-containing protein [Planctomycetota bacterium]MBU1519064.1 NUDIX domain-containing protein [Planctomycetota bacterium]MBU2596381.1 NUDIX domain-containing protein [Planctomycetota bacterium]